MFSSKFAVYRNTDKLLFGERESAQKNATSNF